MDARVFRALVSAATVCFLGANYASYSASAPRGAICKSPHFEVTAPTPQLAREVCTAAERYRRDLAIEWLGHPLPEWQSPCQIQVHIGPHLGAGGATSFAFVRRQPVDFRMTIQGNHARLLDSVLPHEITHTIFATHFGRPLPRWADEGGATSVEHISERSKQDKLLVQFLTTDRGIAFNRMFAMREYPKDILPLYSQGYSLARFLIAQGGRRKFVKYIGDGLRTNNWTAATAENYGFASISELQLTWLDWVRRGSPANTIPRRPNVRAIASVPSASRATTPVRAASATRAVAPTPLPLAGLVPLPNAQQVAPTTIPAPNPTGVTTASTSAKPAAGSWYARQRDAKPATANPTTRTRTARTESSRRGGGNGNHEAARPQAPGRPRQVILQWSRNDPPDTTLRR